MIYTCTTNPSLDYYVSLPSFELNKNNRSDMEVYDAGGKGVNVSIVLNNFRIPSVATGFLGGFTKDFYLSFITNYPYVQPLFTTIEDNTRINIKFMDPEFETSINARGPHIKDEEFDRFKRRLSRIFTDDIFVLSGNIEDEIKDKIVDLVDELCQEGVKVILDTDKEITKRCMDLGIFGVKLNDNNIDDDVMTEAKKYLDAGVKVILYSAPQKTSYMFSEDQTLVCENFKDSLVNVTGSADSMVAGALYGMIHGADLEECFRYANAASLATNMSNDLGSKEKIEEVFNTIEVKKL